jgi:hypothetical protein
MDNKRLDKILTKCVEDNVLVYERDCPKDTVSKRLLFYLWNYVKKEHDKRLCCVYVPSDVFCEVEWHTFYYGMVIIPVNILSAKGSVAYYMQKHKITLPHGSDSLIIGQDADGWTCVGCCDGAR